MFPSWNKNNKSFIHLAIFRLETFKIDDNNSKLIIDV